VTECHKIIQTNSDSPQSLRVILGILQEQSKQVTEGAGKEVYALLFGYLGKVWKGELKDPLDRPPSLNKTISRILDSIFSLFRENSKLVNRACGMAMAELLDNCYQDKSDPDIPNIFVLPLTNLIISGSDKAKQTGAAFCLAFLLDHLSK